MPLDFFCSGRRVNVILRLYSCASPYSPLCTRERAVSGGNLSAASAGWPLLTLKRVRLFWRKVPYDGNLAPPSSPQRRTERNGQDAERGRLRSAHRVVDEAVTVTNVRLTRQKAALYQWLAAPLWFPTEKIVCQQIRGIPFKCFST